ncbi:MAG: DUF1232 domain-containing protein [Candidatus Cloacimonetes bacterium]|nr:DUF1232 domain-containing protein [Candidatus Cloacimonadota bacterium]
MFNEKKSNEKSAESAVIDEQSQVVIDDPKRKKFYEKLRKKIQKLAVSKGGEKAGAFTKYILALPDFFVLLCRLAVDKRVSKNQKFLVAGIIAYVISPIDIIPDFIPFIGYVDDLVLVVFGLNIILNELDKAIVLEHWSGDEDVLKLLQKITYIAENFLDKNILKKIKNWFRNF